MAARGSRSSKDTPVGSESDTVVVPMKDLEILIGRAVKKQLDEFKAELRAEMKELFKEQLDRLETRIKDLEDDINLKTEKLMQLESTVDKLSVLPNQENVVLSPDLDAVKKVARDALVLANDNEQYSRRNNIRIRGLQIPEKSDVKEFVTSWISSSLHLEDVTSTDITVAHRLRSRKRNDQQAKPGSESVIVRFQNREVRDRIIQTRKILKNTQCSISDDLTGMNVQLINRLKNDDHIIDAWSWHGKIFAKRTDNKIVSVRPFQTVDELFA